MDKQAYTPAGMPGSPNLAGPVASQAQGGAASPAPPPAPVAATATGVAQAAQQEPQAQQAQQPIPGAQLWAHSANPFAPQLAQQLPTMPGPNTVTRPLGPQGKAPQPKMAGDCGCGCNGKATCKARTNTSPVPQRRRSTLDVLSAAVNKRASTLPMLPGVAGNAEVPAAAPRQGGLQPADITVKKSGSDIGKMFGMERSGAGLGSKKPKINKWYREGEDAFLDRSELYYGSGKRKRSGGGVKSAMTRGEMLALLAAVTGGSALAHGGFDAVTARPGHRTRGFARGLAGGVGSVLGAGAGLLPALYAGAKLEPHSPFGANVATAGLGVGSAMLGNAGAKKLFDHYVPEDDDNSEDSLMTGSKYAMVQSNSRLLDSMEKSAWLPMLMNALRVGGQAAMGAGRALPGAARAVGGAVNGAMKAVGTTAGAATQGAGLAAQGVGKAIQHGAAPLQKAVGYGTQLAGRGVSALGRGAQSTGRMLGDAGGYLSNQAGAGVGQQMLGRGMQGVGLGLQGAGGLTRLGGRMVSGAGQAAKMTGDMTGLLGRGVARGGGMLRDAGGAMRRNPGQTALGLFAADTARGTAMDPQARSDISRMVRGFRGGYIPKYGSALDPFAQAFLDRCSSMNLSQEQFELAVKRASAVHPDVAEALAPLAGMQKQAFGGLLNTLRTGWNAVRGGAAAARAATGAAAGAARAGYGAARVGNAGMAAGRAARVGEGLGKATNTAGKVLNPIWNSGTGQTARGMMTGMGYGAIGDEAAGRVGVDTGGYGALTGALAGGLIRNPLLARRLASMGQSLPSGATNAVKGPAKVKVRGGGKGRAAPSSAADATHPDLTPGGGAAPATSAAAPAATNPGMHPDMYPNGVPTAAAPKVKGRGGKGGKGGKAQPTNTTQPAPAAYDGPDPFDPMAHPPLPRGNPYPGVSTGVDPNSTIGRLQQFFTLPTQGLAQRGLEGSRLGTAQKVLSGAGLGSMGLWGVDKYVDYASNRKADQLAQSGGWKDRNDMFDTAMMFNQGDLPGLANHMWSRMTPEQQAATGFDSPEHALQVASMYGNGDVMGLLQHGWSRLSPQQKMMIGGGAALAGGGLLAGMSGNGGGAGTVAGLGGLGLMGAGLLSGPGNRSGIFQQHAMAPQNAPMPTAGGAEDMATDPNYQQQGDDYTGVDGQVGHMIRPRNELALQQQQQYA